MARVFTSNFEIGALVDATYGWDSETDTVSQLDICHYKEAARYPWPGAAPYAGAYCMRAVLSGGTADAYVKEGDIDISAAATTYFHFNVWFSPTFTGTSNDTFALFEAQTAGQVVVVSIGARIVAATNVINIGAGLAAPTSFAAQDIQRGVWYTIEVKVLLDSGVGNDGTIDVYVTRAGDPAQGTAQISLTGLDQAAVTDGYLGIQDQLATTTGVILYDNFIQDGARLYPRARYAMDPVLTGVAESGHVFVGPGWIAGAAILGGTSPTMILYDTDTADTTNATSYQISLATASTNQSSVGGHIKFEKGCYVVLGGTSPVGQVMLVRSDFNPGVYGPMAITDANVRRLARGNQ